ncbi:MAG: 30S ribosomal protein S8 [bacterium]|nr:30S ribosomal protein S8 [bacterium]
MVSDPIGDLLIQIKNASLSRKQRIDVPYSRVKHHICDILTREGYVRAVEKGGSEPKWMLRIALRYSDKTPAIVNLKRISKPGLRIYVPKEGIPRVLGGLGISIISTSQGIMTGSEAGKRGLGGELLCEIW